MLKWLLLLALCAELNANPGVYDEYTYDDEKENGEEDYYYLSYDEEEEEEEDLDDETLKKIIADITNVSDEDEDKPKRGGRKNSVKRPKRDLEEIIPRGEGLVEALNKKALKEKREAVEAEAAVKSRTKRFLDKIIRPIIKEIFKQHPRPLTKEQRDKISGGFFGWQYAMITEDCCSCKEDNTCSCCPSTNLTGTDCVKFEAQPNKAKISMDIGAHRHVEITVAKNARSMACEHANLKDVCIYSDSFTPTDNGYKACVIITNNVKDPKEGVIKCINYENGKTNISDS